MPITIIVAGENDFNVVVQCKCTILNSLKKLLVSENAAPIICCDDWVYNVGIVAINGLLRYNSISFHCNAVSSILASRDFHR